MEYLNGLHRSPAAISQRVSLDRRSHDSRHPTTNQPDNIDVKLGGKEHIELSSLTLQQHTDHVLRSRTPTEPLQLLSLPPEVLLLVIQNLPFPSIVHLRRTCKYLRSLATPKRVRGLIGPGALDQMLLSHCNTCLLHDPFRNALLQSAHAHPNWPFAARCIPCAVGAHDDRLKLGEKVVLGTYDSVWVCWWCGWPITEGASVSQEQFHRECYKRYNKVLMGFLLAGLLQMAMGAAGAGLAWKWYREVRMVFAPTVTLFILSWLCLLWGVARGTRPKFIPFSLALEVIILGLWIAPVYYVATTIRDGSEPIGKSQIACLVIFSINTLFRLLNVFGYVIILTNYNIASHYRPGLPQWRKVVGPILGFLICWTWPQSIECATRVRQEAEA